jgi:hypothetical protein
VTPDTPRAFGPRYRVSQPASDSDSAEQMSSPRISRCASALTPVATRTWVLTTRPPGGRAAPAPRGAARLTGLLTGAIKRR